MQAVVIPSRSPPGKAGGGSIAQHAVWQSYPMPQIGPQEILLQVAATGLNRADSLMLRGLYPPPAGVIPVLGLECAGIIRQIGREVNQWRVGQRVMALLPGGGMAEYAAVHGSACLPWPDCFSAAQAGSFMECFAAVMYFLQRRAGLTAGETVLVHGGTSGIGTAALACGKVLDWQVYTTSSTMEKCQQASSLGAKAAFCYKQADWVEQALHHCPEGVDVVLDPIGAAYLSHHLRLLGPSGRLCTIGLQGGRNAQLDMAILLQKQLTWLSGTLRMLSQQARAVLLQALWQRLEPFILQGELQPVVACEFAAERIEQAFAVFEQGDYCGKLVVIYPDV